MSRPTAGRLRGTTIRKSASSNTATRSTTPQIQSTSSTIFGGGVKDATGKVSEFSSMDDQCPVCKSDRYLNPKLRLLVSTCYHKMCESCIDRLFTLGPAPCPICNKVLRKLAFMPQTFEDLVVEKEVTVRRRLAKEFNKKREDFPDLRSYNDYLEEVEDITFNLINEINVAETDERIRKFREENAAIIEANIQRDQQYAIALQQQEEEERRRHEDSARELLREDEEEREAKEAERRALIDKLSQSDKDARKLVAQSRAEAVKKQKAKQAAAAASASQSNAKMLRARAVQSTIPDVPHVPFQDYLYVYDDLFVLKPGGYHDPTSEAVRRDREGVMRGGGYIVEEAWERAIRCAVAGLDTPPLSSSKPPILDSSGDIIMAHA